MRVRYGINLLTAACLFSLSLAGCARSPQVNFYTLTPVSQSTATITPFSSSVLISPITLPEYVDRQHLVLNTVGPRVHVLEVHRWAEPLKSSIPRILAEDLSLMLGTDRVFFYSQNSSGYADYLVGVDFLQFESSGDSVQVDALWTIRVTADSTGKTHRSKIREKISGDGNEERVTAYSRALAILCRDIADSLHHEQATSRVQKK